MIAEMWKETHIDAYMRYFSKEKKTFTRTRYLYAILFFIMYAMVVLMLKNYVFFAGLPIAFLIGYKMPYLNLMLLKEKQDLTVSFLFPQFLQSFMALLSSSGNVYQALKATIPYTEEPLKEELEKLVKNIEKENKRDDYLAFAEFIGTSEAYMIIDMIYQFSEFGIKKDALREMQGYIQSLQENKTDELITRKMTEMDKLGFAPIFISLFLVGGFAVVIFLHYMQDVMDALSVMP